MLESEHLHRPVEFMPECIGPEVKQKISTLEPGQILLLENLRFHAEEETNDDAFAAQLAEGSEVFVLESFPAQWDPKLGIHVT